MSITITKTITDEQLACLSNDLIGFPNDINIMIAELQRRIDWVIDHKVEQCARRMVDQQSHLLYMIVLYLPQEYFLEEHVQRACLGY